VSVVSCFHLREGREQEKEGKREAMRSDSGQPLFVVGGS
jgi:hypothetical protein